MGTESGSTRPVGSGRSTELIVVDPRPVMILGLHRIFEEPQWQLEPVDEAEVGEIGIGSGVALVATAAAEPPRLVDTLSRRGRSVAVYGRRTGPGVFEAFVAGAVVFVPEDQSPAQLTSTVAAMRDGEIAAVPERDRLQALLRSPSDPIAAGFAQLTRREGEVLESLMAGLAPSQIAERDFVSVTTVRNQVQAVLTKLNVHSQLQAVAAAYRYGWLQRRHLLTSTLSEPLREFDAFAS